MLFAQVRRVGPILYTICIGLEGGSYFISYWNRFAGWGQSKRVASYPDTMTAWPALELAADPQVSFHDLINNVKALRALQYDPSPGFPWWSLSFLGGALVIP